MTSKHCEFDYVTVGAGFAGCVLAGRLRHDSSVSALLLEARGRDCDPRIKFPLGWGMLLSKRLHDWGYFTKPDPGMDGREVECARGKVIGGSSSINATAHARGHRNDCDLWAAQGLGKWSCDQVLPRLRGQERREGNADCFYGNKRLLYTQRSKSPDVLVDGIMVAAQEAGHALTDDYNGEQQEGFSILKNTIRDGRRCCAADAFLRPALRRKNLSVITHASTTRFEIDSLRAVGVNCAVGEQPTLVRAKREVIASAGVFNSPHLLILSGTGDRDELTKHSIPTKVAAKGVGKNPEDPVIGLVRYRRKTSGPFQKAMRADRTAWKVAKADCFGKGFARDLASGYVAFLKSDPSAKAPEIQFLSNIVPLDVYTYMSPFCKPFADAFSILPVLLNPESWGTTRLRRADPFAAPRIFPNFLATDRDKRVLHQAARVAREIGHQSALQPYIECELDPGPACISDDDIDAHIRAAGLTSHHTVGLCKMRLDTDDHPVVDQDIRMFVIDGLRVVDASVMPDLIAGNINAPVMMMASKAGDAITATSLSH